MLKFLHTNLCSGYIASIFRMCNEVYAFICRLLLTDDQIDLFIVHLGGLTIDMFGGILLLFDKTRPIALFLLASFHFMNSTMFSIGNYSQINAYLALNQTQGMHICCCKPFLKIKPFFDFIIQECFPMPCLPLCHCSVLLIGQER